MNRVHHIELAVKGGKIFQRGRALGGAVHQPLVLLAQGGADGLTLLEDALKRHDRVAHRKTCNGAIGFELRFRPGLRAVSARATLRHVVDQPTGSGACRPVPIPLRAEGMLR